MSVRTVCLGWHWQPYRYTRTADDANGQRVLDFPDWLADFGRAALAEAYDSDAALAYRPETALVNYYDDHARLGMHQDKDEKINAPVVSLSIGDSCCFRFGNTDSRGKPYSDIDLASGDAFVRTPITLRVSRSAHDLLRHRKPRVRSSPGSDQHHYARHRPHRPLGITRRAALPGLPTGRRPDLLTFCVAGASSG